MAAQMSGPLEPGAERDAVLGAGLGAKRSAMLGAGLSAGQDAGPNAGLRAGPGGVAGAHRGPERPQPGQPAPGGEAAPGTDAAPERAPGPACGPAAPELGAPPAALWFPDPPAKPARLLPPLALAYIGDAVYEVAVRQHVMARPNLRPHHLHGQSTKYVSAKAQARLLELIEPLLTEEEKDVVRQGRNAKSGTVPKNANVLDYRLATAFEGLVGYLYYTGAHDRLRWLIAQGFAHLEDNRDRG